MANLRILFSTPPAVRFLGRRVYPGAVIVLIIEPDTNLGQGRCNVGDGGLDRRLLDLEIPGEFQRVVVVGSQSEGGAGLLDGCPRLLLLLDGDLQCVVPLVDIFLADASVRQELLAPPQVVPRQLQGRLPALEGGELGVQNGDVAPQGLLGVLPLIIGRTRPGDLRTDLEVVPETPASAVDPPEALDAPLHRVADCDHVVVIFALVAGAP